MPHHQGDQHDEHARFRRIESVFAQLCDLPREQPEAIEEHLARLTNADADLAREIRAMLDLDRLANPALDRPAIRIDAGDEPIPETLGPYTILGVLGEGGMGVVYEAQQHTPKRRVALKVIRDRVLHDKIRKRFRREADILAKLSHPGIATIYESGVTDDSRTPYVAMELIEGEPITRYADTHGLSSEQRAALLLEVCHAVGHAHDAGIVHRDLKPANILIDRQGQPKVLDFGIAQDLRPDQQTLSAQTADQTITQPGQLLGTLQYMAPEQVDDAHGGASARTDVYALGLIAFELLTGQRPHSDRASSVYELIRAIRDDEPRSLGAVDRSLRGDLETIIAKALERDPQRRYEHAGALAEDLRRFLAHQPIAARKPGAWYQLRKFSQRNPLLVGSVAAIMIVLSVALVLIANALRIANTQRVQAQAQQHAQELTARFVTEDLLSAGNPDFGGDAGISLLQAMRLASDKIPERFADAPAAEAAISFTMGDQFRLMNDFDKAKQHLQRSVEISKSLPELHIDALLNRYNSLIDIYTDIDDLDTATALAHEADALMKTHPELSPTIRIDTLVQHASILYYKRDLDNAAAIFQQAVDLGAQAAPHYNGTVDAATALAMVYTSLRRFERAQDMHLRGIALRIATNGPEHPATLQAQDNLGVHYLMSGQPGKALDLLQETLATRMRVFGPEHNKTHLTRGLIGRSYLEQADLPAAETHLLPAYDGLVKLLGPEHRYTLVMRDLLHRLYTQWGKPDRAARFAPITTPQPKDSTSASQRIAAPSGAGAP